MNGSPRINGNTSALIKAFTRGALESGHTVNTFVLEKMTINSCKGCIGGGKNPDSPCVQKDDMDKIYPSFRDADIVVLASPLYFWNLSGQLKTALDRLFAAAESNNYKMPEKESVLLMAAESNEYDEALFWYERLVKHLNWLSLGRVLVGSVMDPGDIQGKPELINAYELGKSID